MACREETRDSRTPERFDFVDIARHNLVRALDLVDVVGEHGGAFCVGRNDNVQEIELRLDDVKVELFAGLVEKDIDVVVANMPFFQVVVLVPIVVLH